MRAEKCAGQRFPIRGRRGFQVGRRFGCEWIAFMTVEHSNHVLLVDDDPAMRRMISKWLEGAGYQIRVAENGRDAILAIEQQRPQILLTDWDMPQMDGLQAIQILRAQGHKLPIVALTALASLEDEQMCLRAGATAFLSKPFDPARLARLLQESVGPRD